MAIQGALIHSSREADAAVVAGLGWDEVRFRTPARVGDTLSVRLERSTDQRGNRPTRSGCRPDTTGSCRDCTW